MRGPVRAVRLQHQFFLPKNDPENKTIIAGMRKE